MSTFSLTLAEVIERGHNIGLGPDDYPIFDEDYRPRLNKLIIDRNYHNDIGYETVEMFTFNLNRKLREIMPFYNKLYESTRLEYDPLLAMDLTEVLDSVDKRTATEDATQVATTLSNTDSKARAVQSETPQVMLAGNKDYASSAQDTVSDSKVDGSSDTTGHTATVGEGEAKTTRTQKGYTGSAAVLVQAYRSTLINVDLMVLSELEPCFMLVWNTGDQYTDNAYGFGGGYNGLFGMGF